MPRFDQALLARYGREPLALALEHIERFPARTIEQAQSREKATERARAFVLAAASKQASLGDFVFTGFTCGYFKNADGLAVIPVWGDVGPRRYFWPWTWYEDIAAAAETASKDGDVKAVLFHIDSPGGYVTGNAECAGAIAAAAALKPCAAHANDLAASAAYWLASAASRLSAPPTGVVGSIGAMCTHFDVSQMLEDEGVTASIIRSAPRKAETNSLEPLSPAARQQLQHEITVCADQFIAGVAKLRGLDEIAIRGTQAACLTIETAVAGGFADAIESFDQACAALLARAAVAPTVAPPAAPSTKTPKPARGTAAHHKASRPRAAAKQGVSAPARTAATKRSAIMDPTTLPPEEQIKRYDEIAAIIAEEPADDNAKIGQFVQIVGIINRDAEDTTTGDTTTEDTTTTEEAPAARAKAAAWTPAQLNSAEAKANPAGALAAQAAGVTFAQFKALAPNMSKGGGLSSKMRGEQSAQRVGSDAPAAPGGGNVTALNPQAIYAARKAQTAGGKK